MNEKSIIFDSLIITVIKDFFFLTPKFCFFCCVSVEDVVCGVMMGFVNDF